MQKVLVVNLTPTVLTETQFIRTKEKYQKFLEKGVIKNPHTHVHVRMNGPLQSMRSVS